jgi:hypothetical protein
MLEVAGMKRIAWAAVALRHVAAPAAPTVVDMNLHSGQNCGHVGIRTRTVDRLGLLLL